MTIPHLPHTAHTAQAARRMHALAAGGLTCLTALALLGLGATASAQSLSGRPSAAPALSPAPAPLGLSADANAFPDLRSFGQHWISEALPPEAQSGQPPLRLEVRVGELDPRLQLAPCARVEPFLPPGTRLWGASRLGLRCTQGARWSVFLPVSVKAFGPAWLPARPIAAGSTLQASDFTAGEADWAALPSPVVQSPEQWVGQVAAQPLSPGQPLRQSMLRPPQAFAAGSAVRLVVEGPGFSIQSDGQALSAGYIGQSVRVRTDNGRAVAGTVLDARTVRLDL